MFVPYFSCSTNGKSPSFNWKDLTDNDLLNYSINTKKDFSRIRIPLDALQCKDMSCTSVLYSSKRY